MTVHTSIYQESLPADKPCWFSSYSHNLLMSQITEPKRAFSQGLWCFWELQEQSCDASSPSLSLPDTAFVYKMKQEAIISLGHTTFFGWDSGRECWGGKGSQSSTPDPTAGSAVPVWSTAHTSGGHAADTLCKWKNGIYARQTSLGQELPNYQWTGASRPGDERQQPQSWEVSLLRGRAGAVPRCASGPRVKPIVGRTPPAPGERAEEGEAGTNLLHLLCSS